jgi:hypothetical protein
MKQQGRPQAPHNLHQDTCMLSCIWSHLVYNINEADVEMSQSHKGVHEDTYRRCTVTGALKSSPGKRWLTALCCQVHGEEGAQHVFASCLGDSKALLFDMETGQIPKMKIRSWDHEVGTLSGPGVESELRAETFCHNLTGALVSGRQVLSSTAHAQTYDQKLCVGACVLGCELIDSKGAQTAERCCVGAKLLAWLT